MLFNELAISLQALEQTESRNSMVEQLAELFKKLSPQQAQRVVYLLSGQLYPIYKNLNFGLADKQLSNILLNFWHKIAVKYNLGYECNKLWLQTFDLCGDLGTAFVRVAETIQLPLGNDPWNIDQVYEHLEQLAVIQGNGSVESKAEWITQLLEHQSALANKFILRIIVGKLRLGCSEMTMLEAFSWMHGGKKNLKKVLEHAFNVCVDLGWILRSLKVDGLESIAHMQPTLGIPLRPAAAERLASAKEIIEKLGPCVAQPKIDGLRLQVHCYQHEGKRIVQFFSRNMLDVTNMFPDLAGIFEQWQGPDFIAEGEAIAQNAGGFLAFQQTSTRRRKHNAHAAAEATPLTLYLFDLLFLAGASLLNVIHSERNQKLQALVQAQPDLHDQVVVIAEQVFDFDPNQPQQVDNAVLELEEYFQEMINHGYEGLMVKKPDAVYQAGKRNFSWIKLKRQHVDGFLMDSIDCVIMGGYRGKGKRAGFAFGVLLVGVYDSASDSFVTIAKVGTGLSDQQWAQLGEELTVLKADCQPANYRVADILTPDVWFTPKLVIAIEGEELSLSPNHTAAKDALLPNRGLGIRFPRVLNYRFDKGPAQATEVKEVISIYKMQRS